MYVYAENGDRYLDFFAGIAVSAREMPQRRLQRP